MYVALFVRSRTLFFQRRPAVGWRAVVVRGWLLRVVPLIAGLGRLYRGSCRRVGLRWSTPAPIWASTCIPKSSSVSWSTTSFTNPPVSPIARGPEQPPPFSPADAHINRLRAITPRLPGRTDRQISSGRSRSELVGGGAQECRLWAGGIACGAPG